MLGDTQEMQVGPVVENDAADRDADGAAQAAHEGIEAARRFHAFGGKPAKGQRDR